MQTFFKLENRPCLVSRLAVTAAASATTPAAAEPAASAAAAKAALRLRSRFVDIECPAVQSVAIEGLDRLIGLSFICHFHERESARPPGIPVGHDAGTVDGSVPLKQGAQRFFGSVEIQIAYEDVLHIILLTI